MTSQPADRNSAPAPIDRRAAVAGFVMLGLLGLLAVGLVALVLGGDAVAPGGSAQAAQDPASAAYAEARPAPALELTDQEGNPFTLESLRGEPVLVFFGYTHCPDVCPATVGIVNQALSTTGEGPRAVFVSIDPERDDVAAMSQYLRYLPKAYVGLSGTPEDVRRNADAWGVKYARIETDSANGYAMAHTADVFLVDGEGMLRAHFPFGTQADPIAAALQALMAETAAGTPAPAAASTDGVAPAITPGPGTPPPAATPVPAPGTATTAPVAGTLDPLVVSSSIWSGGGSPIILTARDASGVALDGAVPVSVRVVSTDGATALPQVPATAVRPEGSDDTSFVAIVDIPSPGSWRLDVLAADGRSGSTVISALDPGSTAPLGKPAPAVDTPTLDDVGGVVRAVTTQPNPDLRLSKTSTAEARAAGRPYVLVVDSARFKVTEACGRALTMIRYLLDRWRDVTFVHLEPFEYQVITEEPVLNGTLEDPPLNRYARAFGLGPEPWTGLWMPWIFVVDGQGMVRAKYTDIVGSADVDVILSLIRNEGAIGG
ncbi:MAG: SCO family protein [Chloroflexi bacterium]|nr:SCO family protein [Chloroflexota bacterium]